MTEKENHKRWPKVYVIFQEYKHARNGKDIVEPKEVHLNLDLANKRVETLLEINKMSDLPETKYTVVEVSQT